DIDYNMLWNLGNEILLFVSRFFCGMYIALAFPPLPTGNSRSSLHTFLLYGPVFRQNNLRQYFPFQLLQNPQRIFRLLPASFGRAFRCPVRCQNLIHLLFCLLFLLLILFGLFFLFFRLIFFPDQILDNIDSEPVLHISADLIRELPAFSVTQKADGFHLTLSCNRSIYGYTVQYSFFRIISCLVRTVQSEKIILFQKFLLILRKQ